MLTDSQELEITTDSLEAVNAINGFFEQLLSVGNDSQVILKAVEADPTCAIANAHVAAFYLFSGTSDTIARATDFLNAAKAQLSSANEREQLYIAAIEAWTKRDLKSAIAYHEAISELGSVLPRLQEAGGSHAQRDLFEQVYLDALIRSSKYQEALDILEKRYAKRS
ncbi:hypothetical protein WA1_33895 [Scytonema hofmannii PCC 7110]|uniref:Tetratrico peptide repeat group 5 domain-containing protein n=1 Tax=Scytonema hofmannii PCC 7110 TaxID=128403 RepID=A0A139X2Q7_9CYAN|nr:hypothetical protein [Scytonema hofmannii]KYC38989.1 hypothetical protein WA1_33895 [Scytonema hofmannii PCC 7110]